MLGWLLSPGDTRSRALAVVRVAIGVIFVLFSSAKFFNHASEVADFRHWGLTISTGTVVLLIGSVELVGGLVLATGIATRPAALMLTGDMAGAILTAGRVDGGFHLIVPPLLAAACLLLALRGGGARQFSAGGSS